MESQNQKESPKRDAKRRSRQSGNVVVCRDGNEMKAVQQSMAMQAEKVSENKSGSVDSSGQYF